MGRGGEIEALCAIIVLRSLRFSPNLVASIMNSEVNSILSFSPHPICLLAPSIPLG